MPGRTHLVVVALAVVAASTAACGGANRAPATAAPGMHGIGATAAPAVTEPTAPAEVLALAREVATPNTDGAPFEVVRTQVLSPAEAAAAGRRSQSEEIAVGTNGAPAYLITFRGRFVGHGVSYPSGTQPPNGRYFTVGIDGAGPRVTGLSITGDEPAPWHDS